MDGRCRVSRIFSISIDTSVYLSIYFLVLVDLPNFEEEEGRQRKRCCIWRI